VNQVLDTRGVAKAGGTVLPNAAVAAPEIDWILTHREILRSVRDALGCAEPVFTLEADLHRNYIARAWHKDTGEQVMDDGYFGMDPFGRDDCRVVKVAAYLQDHRAGRGLHVRPGSHRSSAIGSGDGVEVVTRAGDIVLFDVRISHRGVRPGALDAIAAGATRLTARRDTALRMAARRRRLGAFVGRPDRMAVYFAFGIANDRSNVFATRNMRRQLSQLGEGDIEIPLKLRRAFDASRVRIAQTSMV
jgi:hypothetical protein